MAGNKYIANNAGAYQEVAANQTSAGAGDAGKIPALDSTGRLDESMMPVGVAAETQSIVTTEDISGGSLVNIYVSTGVKCRKADATTSGKEAKGFVLASTTSGQSATVYFSELNTAVTGLTPGATYFLDTTAGGVNATAPSSSGNIVQEVGVATAAGVLIFQPKKSLLLA